MSYEMMYPPLHLSEAGHAKAIEIYDLFKSDDRKSLRVDVDRAVAHLSNEAWSRYDDVYLALYTLSLMGHGRTVPLPPPPYDKEYLPHRGAALFELKVDLRNDESPFKFLDERGVATFINFRNSLEGLVPYYMVPTSIGFGCIFVEFSILIPKLPLFNDYVGPENQAVATQTLISSLFRGERWHNLKQRFRVQDVAVSAIS